MDWVVHCHECGYENDVERPPIEYSCKKCRSIRISFIKKTPVEPKQAGEGMKE